ncbi:MAG: T9SS type A sorting domain-containing protein [Bacteroidota bacterium]
MNKILLLLLGIVLSLSYAFAQQTFNKQYYFDSFLAVGNSVHVTDSCYYFSGLIVDTLPPYDEGIIFGRLDLNGELQEADMILDTNLTFQNWLTPLIYNAAENAFISMGYGSDSIGNYNYWMKISPDGERLGTRFFRNAYYPLSPFTRVNDFLFHKSSNEYFVLNESNIGENDIGLTPGYNTSITKLNALGDSIDRFTYEFSWNHLPVSMLLQDDKIIVGIEESNHNITSFDRKARSRIISVDTNFQMQWAWTSPNNTQQGANDIIAEDDGSLIVASARGFLEDVNAGTRIMLWDRGLVFKLDENQEIAWETELEWGGRNFTNRLTRMVRATGSDGYVVAGTVAHPYHPGPGGRLGYLAKVSTTGDSLWARRLLYYELPDSIEYEHHIHDLQATPDGGYFMSGYTLDRVGAQAPPRQRAWFIKVDSEGCLIPGCGLVDTQAPTEQGPAVLLYPNPAAEHLNVYLGDSGGQQWHFLLFDAAGRQMGSYAAPTPHTTYMLPVRDYPAGTYYIQVVNEQGRGLKTYPWVKGD